MDNCLEFMLSTRCSAFQTSDHGKDHTATFNKAMVFNLTDRDLTSENVVLSY